MAIKERLDSLSRGELAGLIAVLVITLAGAGLWYSRSLPKPVQIASSAGPMVAGLSRTGSVDRGRPGPAHRWMPMRAWWSVAAVPEPAGSSSIGSRARPFTHIVCAEFRHRDAGTRRYRYATRSRSAGRCWSGR